MRSANAERKSRVVHGAIAGVCATMVMTTVMRHLEWRLDPRDRYPLPPREITEDVLDSNDSTAATSTLLAHFGFGALSGALYGLLPKRPPAQLYGPLVWTASYLGWVRLTGILKPATRHPVERNMLMLAAHVVWGDLFGRGMNELDKASRTIFAAGRLEDREGREHTEK